MNWKTAARFLIALALCYFIIRDGSVFTAVAVFLLFLRQEMFLIAFRSLGHAGLMGDDDVRAAVTWEVTGKLPESE